MEANKISKHESRKRGAGAQVFIEKIRFSVDPPQAGHSGELGSETPGSFRWGSGFPMGLNQSVIALALLFVRGAVLGDMKKFCDGLV